MIAFVDSSALVKLYADEPGSEFIRELTRVIIVCELARVEVPSAVWRKHRMGELSAPDAALLTKAFELDWCGSNDAEPRFEAIAVATVLDEAAALVAVHGLKAYDGIQLAAAKAARRAVADCDTLIAFDRDLRRAAAAERFDVAPS